MSIGMIDTCLVGFSVEIFRLWIHILKGQRVQYQKGDRILNRLQVVNRHLRRELIISQQQHQRAFRPRKLVAGWRKMDQMQCRTPA